MEEWRRLRPVEETSPLLIGLAEKGRSKPKGFRGRVEGALGKERVRRRCLPGGCCMWLDNVTATEREWPPRDQLVNEIQSAFQGLAHWETRRMQHVEEILHVVKKRGDEPPAILLEPKDTKTESVEWFAIHKGSDDRTSGED
jgi:hypothetical protein